VYLPKSEYNMIIEEISKGKDCKIDDYSGLVMCPCMSSSDDKFPTIGIQVGSKKSQHWFYLKNIDYLSYSAR
jgi:hypothetical protein